MILWWRALSCQQTSAGKQTDLTPRRQGAKAQSRGANVNYAVKISFLLSFLESVPEVSARLKPPATADRKFEDVVKSAQSAAVLVLVY
jgi:hypothetical protein